MVKKYIVTLTSEEKEELQLYVSRGKLAARIIQRAHILLQADEGKRDEDISKSLRCSTRAC